MKQNKAEKLLAGVLSISLAMGVSVMPAFAAQVQGPPYEDMSRVYLTKNYELANTGTISPEETFTFAIEPGTVTDASEGIDAADYKPIVRTRPSRSRSSCPSTTAWASTPTSSMRWRVTAQA